MWYKQIPANLLLSLLLLTACHSRNRGRLTSILNDPANGLHQEKTVNDIVLRLDYLPVASTHQEAPAGPVEEWCFRLNVQLPGSAAAGKLNDPSCSFGLDSLFLLVVGSDTLNPLHTLRVANGSGSNAEYMIIFEKQAATNTTKGQLVFRDWLFTNRKLVFPVNPHAIEKIDSISSRI